MVNFNSPTRPRPSRAMAVTTLAYGSHETPWKVAGQSERLAVGSEGKTHVEKILLDGSFFIPFLNSSSDRISTSTADAWLKSENGRKNRARKKVKVICRVIMWIKMEVKSEAFSGGCGVGEEEGTKLGFLYLEE